ncbi:MAG: GreA/GreB family elongation factor [Chitinophagaceae bacterium]|nr:GreA/GreB family elongation factor [Chitinophagaceae bacterium]MCW5928561.1 GreA/GreB family elongation factor [Chitinophagaceae bacterium]
MKPNPVVLCESDFKVLKDFVGISTSQPRANEMSLAYELGRAIVVKDDAIPNHTVRLNSTVTVENVETNSTAAYTIVMPENADISKRKVSVIAPMGAALIGFRKGEEVEWKLPAGLKRFKIIDVVNEPL